MMLKKTVVAAALAAAGTCAFAGGVQLYGTVDGAVMINKAKDTSATVSMEDGIAGGSVWGLTGEEDLGNGYSVNFTLENGFTMDNGENGEEGLQFGKQATLGISGGFGELAFGRMGGLSTYEGSYSIWDASPFGTDYAQAGLGNFGVLSGTILNNAVVYVTPEFSGFTGYAQYGNGDDDADNKWSKNSHYYGLGLTYEAGAFNAAVIYERQDNRADRADKIEASDVISVSAAYDFETVKPFVGYQYGHRMHTMGEDVFTVDGNGFNQHMFTVGAEVPVAGGTAKVAANYAFGKVKGEVGDELALKDDKFNKLSLGAAYEYPLSKRTFVYSWGAWQKGGKALKTEEIRSEFESWSAGFGLHHNF